MRAGIRRDNQKSPPTNAAPPRLYDDEAERLLVGIVMRLEDDEAGKGVEPLIAQGVTAEDFSPGRLPRDIVRVALDLRKRGKPADDIEVGSALTAEGRIESRTNVSDLIDENRTASAINLRPLIGTVLDLSRRRQADRIAKEIAEQAQAGTIDLESAAHQLSELGTRERDREPGVLVGEEAFAGEDESEEKPLIDGLLERGGKMILGGHAKTGKSIFAMNLGLAAAEGRGFLGYRICPSRVLYLDFELNPAATKGMSKRLKQWRERTGRPIPETFEVLKLRHFPNLRQWDVLKFFLRRRVKETGHYDLIIVDCLYRLLGGADENASNEMSQVGPHLDEISADTGAATLTIHHTGKGGTSGKDVRDIFRGSSVLAGEFDCGLSISEHGDEPDHFVLEGFCRDFRQPDPLTFFGGDFPVVEAAPDVEAKKASTAGRTKTITANDIFERIPTEGVDAISAKELAQDLGKNERTVKRRLEEMASKSELGVKKVPRERQNGPERYFRE